MKAFIYLRQSLDKTGEGAAVDRQRADALALCAERGWDVVGEYVDNDTSASSRKPRPAYTRMLEAIGRREADVVVAWHVDRLTRKLTELEALIELAQNTGLRIATVTGDLDLSTDAGRLVGRILASVARGEVERKSARQKRAQQQAAEQGKPAGGRRAFGYGLPTGETRTVRGKARAAYDMEKLNPDEAAHVRQAYADILQGASLKGIAKRWNDAGLRTTAGGSWRHDNVREVLRNPRNAARRTYRGEVVGPATWPPIVDDDTFDTVYALLSLPERRTTDTTARRYLLPGLALCWKCGSDVATGHTRHGKRVYVCRAHKCISRAAEPIDALIGGGFIRVRRSYAVPESGVALAPDWNLIEGRSRLVSSKTTGSVTTGFTCHAVVDHWTDGIVVERLSRPDALELLTVREGPDVSTYRAQAQAIRDRLDDLATGLEEGILTLTAVRRSSQRLRAELASLEARIAGAVSVDALAPLVTASDVGAAWQACDLAQRRGVIDTLMRITLLAPKRGRQEFDPDTVRIEWKAPTS